MKALRPGPSHSRTRKGPVPPQNILPRCVFQEPISTPGPGCRAREERFGAKAWSVTPGPGSGQVPGHEEGAGLAPGCDAPRGGIAGPGDPDGGHISPGVPQRFPLPLPQWAVCYSSDSKQLLKSIEGDPKVLKAISWPGPCGCLAPGRGRRWDGSWQCCVHLRGRWQWGLCSFPGGCREAGLSGEPPGVGGRLSSFPVRDCPCPCGAQPLGAISSSPPQPDGPASPAHCPPQAHIPHPEALSRVGHASHPPGLWTRRSLGLQNTSSSPSPGYTLIHQVPASLQEVCPGTPPGAAMLICSPSPGKTPGQQEPHCTTCTFRLCPPSNRTP